jgi:hypothetical protein
MDFTISTYIKLLNALSNQGFSFLTFEDSLTSQQIRSIILRHDVDLLPLNSLEFARIQADQGIKGSYYFRLVPGSWDEAVIKEIAGMGHEVGYHYEDLGATAQRRSGAKAQRRNGSMGRGLRDLETKGRRDLGMKGEELEKELVNIAIDSFAKNLQRLREIAPVKTICMHGSPMSRWDSRLLWKYYDYKDFGIVGEPYFDVDFEEVMYLTDTGRRWDGGSVAVRDKVHGGNKVHGAGCKVHGENPYADWKVKPFKYRGEAGGEKDLETKRLRDEETKRLRDEETKRQRDEREALSPSVSQSLSLSVPQSLCPSVSQSLSLSVPQSPSLSVSQSLSISVSQSLSPSVPQSLSPSVSSRMPFHKFHSTFDIIRAAENGQLPDKIMMTFHPQRWTDKPFPWVKELVWQNVKNVGKWVLVKGRSE